MTRHKNFIFLFFSTIIITTSIQPQTPTNLYRQINPELLKNINVENPSLEDQQLITACQLTDLHGTQLAPAIDPIWESIVSLEMITEVLPRIARTHSTFGYMALAQQCAQMSCNITKLNKKTDLIKYLDAHPNVFSKLNLIIKRSVPAQEAFLNLCRTHNEEEQGNQDTINHRLYYSSRIGSHLNENGLALGFWTRLNQLHTLAWYTIPTLCFSNIHKCIGYFEKNFDLNDKHQKLLNAQNNLQETEKQLLKKEINELKNCIEKNPICAEKAYQDLINNIKKIDISKQTPIEKYILTAPPLILIAAIPDMWKNSKFETIKYLSLYATYLTKYFVADGIRNAPALYVDVAKGAANFIKDQYDNNPIYNQNKKDLIHIGWDKDEIKTKALAASYTTGTYALITGLASAYPYLLYCRYKSTKELFDLVAVKQKELVQFSCLIHSLLRTHNLLKENTLLQSLMPEHKKIAQLFDPHDKKTSRDLKYLVSACFSSSFAEESYYLSQQGKILATHHLLTRIKHELVPYLQAFGAIDAHLSSYKLYAEFKNHEIARICIPEFIQHETPQLIAQSFWHPLINPIKVVTNSLNMGTTDLSANLLITGPNAGGKTTALMALIINIIMAQSYGIATASHLTLTPFAKIHSYLDITTNLIDGESLFKAEVNRSKKLKESILSCVPGEKTFTIIDELFSGTNPDVASNVGLKFAQLLGNITHSMCIITTHFPQITEVEETTGRFTNYKVADAYIAQDGSITYPFKLEQGKSTQNIAQHMLEQEDII